MLLWTIQSASAYKEALSNGYLEGNSKFAISKRANEYQWMMSQMKKRLPKYKGEYPVWLHLKYPDISRSNHLKIGEGGVLLEVNIPEKDVLISDYNAWFSVVCNKHFFLTKTEEFLHKIGIRKMIKQETWESIFDIELLQKKTRWGGIDLQATTGRIDINNIKKIEEFVAK